AEDDFEAVEDIQIENDFEEVDEKENDEDDFDLDLNIDGLNLEDEDSPAPSTSASTSAIIKAVEKVMGGRKLSDEELEQIKRQDLFTIAEYGETPVEKKIAQIGNVQITLACLAEMQNVEIHSHPNHHETVFLLEGRGTVYLGERANRSEIMSGAFFTIPKNIPHGFKNTQTSEILLLWFHHQ
ncbi:MAG: cupin domain-containing protein, partial [Planctomycetota bacterium]